MVARTATGSDTSIKTPTRHGLVVARPRMTAFDAWDMKYSLFDWSPIATLALRSDVRSMMLNNQQVIEGVRGKCHSVRD